MSGTFSQQDKSVSGTFSQQVKSVNSTFSQQDKSVSGTFAQQRVSNTFARGKTRARAVILPAARRARRERVVDRRVHPCGILLSY